MKSEEQIKEWLKTLQEAVEEAKTKVPNLDQESEEFAYEVARVQQALVLIYAFEWVLSDEE